MKVLLVSNYARDEQMSMLAFADALYSGLSAAGEQIHVKKIAPISVFARTGNPYSGLSKWLGYIDKYLLFPFHLRAEARHADIVHICDHSSSMYTRYLQNVAHLVTCHDMLPIRSALGELPDWKTGKSGKTYQELILAGLKGARKVVCVSEATKRDFCRITTATPSAVPVVYNGMYRPIVAPVHAERYALLSEIAVHPEDKFLLHVGGNQVYKNRLGLLKIFRAFRELVDAPRLKLVMAGKPFTDEIRDYIATNNLTDTVQEIANPTDNQVCALYSAAEALIFPSLYEGFGLPIIEAQLCCCPVFTSNRAPMNEVGADSVTYFNPENHREAAEIIKNGLRNRAWMIEHGTINAQRFTAEQMILGYIGVYQDILKVPKTR